MIEIKGNDTITLEAELLSKLSRLIVKSTPFNANVFLNDSSVGVTPYDSSQIKPSSYTLRVEYPGYIPVKKAITLTSGTTDSLTITLTSIAFRDSVKAAKKLKSKPNIREKCVEPVSGNRS